MTNDVCGTNLTKQISELSVVCVESCLAFNPDITKVEEELVFGYLG